MTTLETVGTLIGIGTGIATLMAAIVKWENRRFKKRMEESPALQKLRSELLALKSDMSKMKHQHAGLLQRHDGLKDDFERMEQRHDELVRDLFKLLQLK